MNSKTNQSQRLRWLIVIMALSIITGGLLRSYKLDSKICWLDESYTLLRISGFTVEEILNDAAAGHISRASDLLKYQQLNDQKDAGSTIYSSAIEHPHIPPLYYLLERNWCTVFGNSIASVRGLSAVFSILCLPLVWIFCIELFSSPIIAAVGTTMMALSPIQVLYAQEARPYSLWCLAILAMSICLLKAFKLGKPWWMLYALTSGLALWVHPLTILVLAAHAVYMLALSIKNRNYTAISSFAISTLGALIIFGPWIYVMVAGLNTIRAHASLSPPASGQSDWLFDISYPFIDLPTTQFFAILALAIPAMQLIALTAFMFTNKRRPFLFLACLGLIPTLSLLFPDLFLGGLRSFIPRYLFPLYLSLLLSMAFLVGTLIASSKRWQLISGSALLTAFILVGLRSDWSMLQEKTWWNKQHSNYLIPVAERINKSESPYLLSAAGVGTMLVLSHLLRPDIPVQLLAAQPIKTLPHEAGDIFLLNPSPKLLLELKNKEICKMSPQDSLGHLWRLEPIH